MGESEEKDGLKLDNNSVFEVRKRFLGVYKCKNRWGARIRHPKLKYEVSLGSYSTPEKAALVVKKKKAEFEEMFKGENSMNVETCRDEFEGRKLPPGVSRRGYRRWGVQIWHPKLKRDIRLGSYSTPEEAAFIADKKRAEFLKIYGEKPKVKRDISDELSGDREVPSGVKKLKSGKWGARIRDPTTRARISLGTLNTAKEAVKSLTNATTELAAKKKRSEFDWLEFRSTARPGFEADEGAVKMEFADGLNTIASLPDKLQCRFDQCSPTSGFEPEISDSADVGDASVIRKGNEQKTGFFDFEEAMSLGFINEYGQLVGEYSKLDEQMWFSLPDD